MYIVLGQYEDKDDVGVQDRIDFLPAGETDNDISALLRCIAKHISQGCESCEVWSVREIDAQPAHLLTLDDWWS